MTARTLIAVTSDDLQLLAFNSGADIEVDTERGRMFLRLGDTTFTAELVQEPTC